MTFQPPPPGGNPPPPPGGQWGPPAGPSGGASGFDPKSVNPLDWGIMGAGVLIFIFSFIDYYTYSGKGEFSSSSVSWSAWHGFFGWFAMLLALVGSAAVAVVLFAPQISLPIPPRLAGLGAYALALVCLVLAIFVVPDYLGGGSGYDAAIDEGHGFGFWASLLLVLAGTVVSLMRLQATGGQLPGALSGVPNLGGYGPQGGINGPTGPAAGLGGAQGYGAPQGGYGPPQSGPPAPGPGNPPPSAPPAPGNPPPPPPPGYGPPR